MPVRVLITRRFKEGKAIELLNHLNQLRATAVNQAGYITGETLMGLDDEQKLLVISTWESDGEWQKWKDDPLRKTYEDKMETLLLEPPSFEVFAFGTLPFH